MIRHGTLLMTSCLCCIPLYGNRHKLCKRFSASQMSISPDCHAPSAQVAVWHSNPFQLAVLNRAHTTVTPVFIFHATPDTYKIRYSGVLNSAFIRLDNVSWAAVPPVVIALPSCTPNLLFLCDSLLCAYLCLRGSAANQLASWGAGSYIRSSCCAG
jgi:hypothetical protein